MTTDTIFYLIILIYSIIAHEVSHGLMAYVYGDRTAKLAGRLTMNPIPHIDLFGSIIIPLISVIGFNGIVFGWAKPVPYNPYNLKNQKIGEIMVSLAGVLMNFALAIIFSLILRFVSLGDDIKSIIYIAVIINLSLGFFNLLPIPPFDGMRVITSIFPAVGRKINNLMNGQSIFFMLIFIFIAIEIWSYLFKYVVFVAEVLTGVKFNI